MEPGTRHAYPQILFANRKPDRSATLEEYRASGGYLALAHALANLSPAEVQHRVLDAALLGRGGAGFPAGRKWMTVADDAPRPRYLVCNADEMEPGTFKDRVLLHADPHLVLEGMALAGYGIGAERGILFIRREYEGAARILDREIARARAAGTLGPNILGSSFSFEISVHRSGGRYICGEATAQLNAIQGKRPNPQAPPTSNSPPSEKLILSPSWQFWPAGVHLLPMKLPSERPNFVVMVGRDSAPFRTMLMTLS